MKTLNSMNFDLVCDSEIDPDDPDMFVSPGGYVINGKWMDFLDYRGSVDREKGNVVHCQVSSIFDNICGITEEDCNGPFSDFIVHIGNENSETTICPVSIEKLVFGFSDGSSMDASHMTQVSATCNLNMLW